MTDEHGGQWIREAVERHERRLMQYAARFIRDPQRAADIVQDTFLKLCNQNKEDIQGHLVEWLYTVCRNRALDVLRKEKRMTQLSDVTLANDQSTEDQPHDLIENNESQTRAIDAIDTLPPKQQEVIRLKFQQGLSYRQISKITDQSVSNVGFLIHAALKSLRKKLVTDPVSATRT